MPHSSHTNPLRPHTIAPISVVLIVRGPDRSADAMSAPIAYPVLTKRKYKSLSGAVKFERQCTHCAKNISCPVLPSGNTHEVNLRRHEKTCKKNPNREVGSVRGLKVGAVFEALGSGAEFQAPGDIREIAQGSKKAMVGAIHMFPDKTWHPVVGKQNGEPLTATKFFGEGIRCCFDEDKSMLLFRNRPGLFPKMYDAYGKCVIAQIGTEQVEGGPAPWPISILRRYSLNSTDKIIVHCIRCNTAIEMVSNRCAQGQGPCRNCFGGNPDIVSYERSFQAYLDSKNLNWTTVPHARTILATHNGNVQITCTLCAQKWPRIPNNQVYHNSGCYGCKARHRAELCAYELYMFVFTEADMFERGKAYLEGIHKNPFDVASTNVKVIVEVMSLTYHVKAGKLPNDTEKMLAALRDGYVYIVVHSEDHTVVPDRESAWKRCIVAALRQAKENATPRMFHVRRNKEWDAYECMREAASEFPYEDIFCGDVNAHATERLPGETHTQTTF